MNPPTNITVLGVGNILQADDGVGIHAVRHLEAHGVEGVELIDAGTSPFDMLGTFQAGGTVIVLDCIRTGAAPGTLHRLSPEDLVIADDDARFAHGLGVAKTVAMAHELGAEASVVVLGLEPASIGWSLELTPEVRAALPTLLDALHEELERLRSGAEALQAAESR